MTLIKLIDLEKENKLFGNEIMLHLKDLMKRGDFILGKEVEEFEESFSKYIGTKYGVGVKSGSSALFLSLLALGIKKEDEIITTPLTFNATIEAIVLIGATPIFCDVNKNGNIDENKFFDLITPNTKAVLGVHLYGNSCNNNEIQKFCNENNIYYIEDACQAHGSRYFGKNLGSFGHISCFSFMPAKVLGCFGDAGIILTNNKEIYDKLIKLRNHGRNDKYLHDMLGFNERIDTIQALILNIKLNRLDTQIKKRREIANIYYNSLNYDFYSNAENINDNNFYVFTLNVKNREELVNALNKKGIQTGVYYPIPCHLQPVFKYLGYKEGDMPNAEKIAKTNLAIPINPYLTKQQVHFIVDTLNKVSTVYANR